MEFKELSDHIRALPSSLNKHKPVYTFILEEKRPEEFTLHGSEWCHFEGVFPFIKRMMEVTEDAEFEVIEPKRLTNG